MHAVRNAPPANTPVAKSMLRHKAKRRLPPADLRVTKKREMWPRLAMEAWRQDGQEGQKAPELLLFDYVQHQAVALLSCGHLGRLLWSSPGDGRDGLHERA